MPSPVKLPPKVARQANRDLDKQDEIVLGARKAMDRVYEAALDQAIAHFMKTGKYKAPDLKGVLPVVQKFYRSTVSAAVDSSETHAPAKKRLAKLPSGDLPEGPRALDRVLTDRRYWQKIMRRARALTERAKKQYLDALEKQFKKIIPLFEIGDLSPGDVKKKISETWKSPAARTETIFRTESTRYFASAQVKYFEGNKNVIGFLFTSVRDTSRTPICKCREGLIYRPGSKELENTTPPLHFNCRSHLIPLINDEANQRLLDQDARNPAGKTLVPVMPGFGKS